MRPTSLGFVSPTRPPARPSLWIAIGDGEGRVGWGEASPLAPFSREDIPECSRVLDRALSCFGEIDEARPLDEAISSALRPALEKLDHAPSARFALETALLDLVGRRRGLAIAELLGEGVVSTRVPVNALLVADQPEHLADRSVALAARGYTAIKIKLVARDEEGFRRELGALHGVRERLPPPFELRLDPNGAWSLDEARRRMTALAPIAPRYVEQPVASGDLVQLGRCDVPWAADESLANRADRERLLVDPGCAAFILKPAILGGLLLARRLAVEAREHGKAAVVTHLFDGPIALAAAAELALSLPDPSLAAGLDPHERVGGWPPILVPQLVCRGAVIQSGAPGLGLDPGASWIPST